MLVNLRWLANTKLDMPCTLHVDSLAQDAEAVEHNLESLRLTIRQRLTAVAATKAWFFTTPVDLEAQAWSRS